MDHNYKELVLEDLHGKRKCLPIESLFCHDLLTELRDLFRKLCAWEVEWGGATADYHTVGRAVDILISVYSISTMDRLCNNLHVSTYVVLIQKFAID